MEAANTQLSYSSAGTLSTCEMKYYHYKVAKTPIDIDADSSTKAFDIGKAFHEVLELNNHTKTDVVKLLTEVKERYNLTDDETLMIHGMLFNYLRLHIASGLEVVKCEYAISTFWFIGYVDVVMQDKQGNWYIVDLKTSARLAPDLTQRMAKDTQLNLYASFADKIAKDLNLDLDKFAGCLYRVTTKSKLKKKLKETKEEYITRVFNNVDTVEYLVKKEDLSTPEFLKRHHDYYEKSLKIRNGEVEPVKNFKACFDFYRPCEYYSNCHGKCFSEADSNTTVRRYEDF